MDMFTPATPESESPDNGHEELEAAATESEEQYEQESYEQEDVEQLEEEQTEEEETDPQDGHSETLLAGKYKSPADLEKAYMELQRQFTRERMQARQQPQQQEPIQQQTPPPGLDFSDPAAVIEAINRDPAGTIAKIAQMGYQQARTAETAEQQFQRGLDEVNTTYSQQLQQPGQVDAYLMQVEQVCRELGVNPEKPSPRILKMAAQELWGSPTPPPQPTNAEVYKTVKESLRKEQEQTRRAKAGLAAPTGAKQQERPKSPEDLIADAIVASSRSSGIFG